LSIDARVVTRLPLHQ